ncbi:sensor histidine kinase [Nonomuraea angiospora]|uniref:histidine kinase n=1 Tax=Nonomuraea angiospora TaxID=46172 RepID=A0ABR9M923_9ACTN|nr:histidine kinase [Nonomuraea angiospora]MBE1589419.1 signal transduction histidine kinase [Nonomuraea angiospora]
MRRTFLKIVRFFRRPRVFDTTLVVVLSLPGLIALLYTLPRGDLETVRGVASYLAGMPLLLMRRRRPLLTVALVTVVDVVSIATGTSLNTGVASSIALYSVGRYTAGRTTAIATVAVFAGYSTAAEVLRQLTGGWVISLFSVGVPVGIGLIVRLRTELAERGRREAADAAVHAERRRIARELHDVVAHHITVINALVGGARATLPPEQEVTRNALESAEQTARQAMSEMRRLLDVLRADGSEGPDAATGVGADRLPSLIKEAKSAGLPAILVVTGEPVALPATVDHAVYRIVQEALTNTRKHATSARASVRLVYEPRAVEVEVVDDGLAAGGGTPGFGLGGMAERVALCGGQLSTGPRPEGGFRVHARIPLETP